jgi:ribosomal protein L11
MDGCTNEGCDVLPKQPPTEQKVIEAHLEDKETEKAPIETKSTELELNTQMKEIDRIAMQEHEAKVLEHVRKHRQRHCNCS